MKKCISILLAAALLLGMAMPVFAGKPEYDAGVEDNDFGSAIAVAEMTLTEPKAGVSVADAVPTPVDGAKFTVEYQWIDRGTGQPVTDKTFRAGGSYRLEYTLTPNVAYWFEESTEISINACNFQWESYGRRQLTGYADWVLYEYLDAVSFPAFPEPQLGDAGTLELQDPDHGMYTYTCDYLDPFTMQPAQSLEAGKCYLLQMTACCNPGYIFLPNAKVLMDGEQFRGLSHVGINVTVTKFVSFGLESEQNIPVNVEAPQGNTALATTAQIATAGAALGEPILWYTDDDGDFFSGNEASATVAREGAFYYLQLYIEAAQGYALAETLDIRINGEPAQLLVLENYGAYAHLVINMGRLGELPGDLNGDDFLNTDDVVALLLHISLPDRFPLAKPADFTGDTEVTTEDAVKLLLHISMPDVFPLN